MFFIAWLFSMVLTIVLGIIAVMVAGLNAIYKSIFTAKPEGEAQWSAETSFASEPLTQFKEFFTGGSVQR
jgi:hypothetical protein